MPTTVNTLISTFLGSIIAAISNASLLYTGHLVARCFFKDEPVSIRWVAFGLVSTWLVIVLSVALIFTHVFTIPGVTTLSIGIAGLAWFFWRRHSSVRQELAEVIRFHSMQLILQKEKTAPPALSNLRHSYPVVSNRAEDIALNSKRAGM